MGQEEDDIGHPYYVASCEEITAVADAETLDELIKEVAIMIKAFLEVIDPEKDLNLIANPRIIRMELPAYAPITEIARKAPRLRAGMDSASVVADCQVFAVYFSSRGSDPPQLNSGMYMVATESP